MHEKVGSDDQNSLEFVRKSEILIKTFVESNYSNMVLITSEGRAKTIRITDIENGSNLKSFIDLNLNEDIVDIVIIDKTIPYTVLITKSGMLKKIETKELLSKRKTPIIIMKLKDSDCIVAACQVDNEDLGILASNGNFIRFSSIDINPIGRAAMGVAGMKLEPNSIVKTIKAISKNEKYLISLTKKGKTLIPILEDLCIWGDEHLSDIIEFHCNEEE